MADFSYTKFRWDLEMDTSKVGSLVDHLRSDTDRKLAIKMLADMLAGDDEDFVIEIKRKGRGKPRDERKIVVMQVHYMHFRKNNSHTESCSQLADYYDVSIEYIRRLFKDGTLIDDLGS